MKSSEFKIVAEARRATEGKLTFYRQMCVAQEMAAVYAAFDKEKLICEDTVAMSPIADQAISEAKWLLSVDLSTTHGTWLQKRLAITAQLLLDLSNELLKKQIPDGWKLVPITLTADMDTAVNYSETTAEAWTALLNAAPEPPTINV